ncbi:MAG: DUF169 domain-containing protein [Thaumarchaeota archaeon]|nr:DUF169 domain-containing protein [Candidatus Calditenuaceae archaeon]MDW8041729.1 DUF169 domain-containing protein [Nitrososphaerota archaeon]
MNPYREKAAEIEQLLNLKRPIVAISFKQESGKGLKRFDGSVSASCVFWTQALDKSFSTVKEQHLNCSIGSVTHGFRKHEEIAPGKGCADVDYFIDLGWVSAEDISKLPTYAHESKTVSYGPLRDVDFKPDACCIFCNAEQALFLMTATQHMIIGKPACAALPVALNNKTTVISLGCTASRTRAGYGPDELVAFIPGEKIEEVFNSLRRVVNIERAVAKAAKGG